jgi:hypothetical protein
MGGPDLLGQRGDPRPVGQIGLERLDLDRRMGRADPGGDRVQRGDVDQHQMAAAPGETVRELLADAARGAGQDSRAPSEPVGGHEAISSKVMSRVTSARGVVITSRR